MFNIIQTCTKEVAAEADLQIYFDNFKKFGWSPEDVENLKIKRTMSRSGKLTDGQKITETVEIKSVFEIVSK